MTTSAPAVIAAFGRIARPIMRKFMPRDSCIASVRTTIEVMRIFRLQAMEIPVSFVFEVPAKKYARVSGFTTAERNQMRRKSQTWRDDIPPGGGWNGHLIAVVEGRWIIDPSIDQAHAPEFGVEILPEILVVDISGQPWDPSDQFDVHIGLTLDNGEAAKLKYRSTKNQSYLDTEAWNDEGLPLLAYAIASDMGKTAGEPS